MATHYLLAQNSRKTWPAGLQFQIVAEVSAPALGEPRREVSRQTIPMTAIGVDGSSAKIFVRSVADYLCSSRVVAWLPVLSLENCVIWASAIDFMVVVCRECLGTS